MSRCVACLQGDFHECRYEGKCGSAGDGQLELVDDSNSTSFDGFSGDVLPETGGTDVVDTSNGNEATKEAQTIRTYKTDSALRDQQSTGRKRAAKMYPLDPESACEWRMKKNCGGGKFPIVGCLGGIQEARHHGPDKDTLNNEEGNVHRICHFCHNRWHTLNDPDYVWGSIVDPHMPIQATIIDVALNEEWWSGKEIIKAKD